LEGEAPNAAYYRAVDGAWCGRFEFIVTDWRAFGAAPLGILDRLRLLSMVYGERLFGALRIETTVSASGAADAVVVHTTRVSKWGMTLMRSVDTLVLARNGRDLTMRIAMRLAPTLWRARVSPPSPASVDADGRCASYRFPWLGTEMRQRGERSRDGSTVTLTQETAFSRGVQVLRRR
ncbi:MAG: hypothetical protein ABI629_22565, partial [bacterium]